VSTPSDSKLPAPAQGSAKKPDLVTLPMFAVLAACVVGAIGNSKGSTLLTWQVPVGLVVLAFVVVGFRALRAKR
jgi:hypothetical protein